MEELINSLKKRNMNGYFVKDKVAAKEKVINLIGESKTIAFGGSVTLDEIGILDHLRNDSNIKLLDKSQVPPEQIGDILIKSFGADVYLSSTNAITRSGIIVNVDGTGNRVAALSFGPRKVIIVAGINKITEDSKKAIHRIRTIALPKNAKRLKDNPVYTVQENMWCAVSSIERQINPDRMHIIIVDEELGY